MRTRSRSRSRAHMSGNGKGLLLCFRWCGTRDLRQSIHSLHACGSSAHQIRQQKLFCISICCLSSYSNTSWLTLHIISGYSPSSIDEYCFAISGSICASIFTCAGRGEGDWSWDSGSLSSTAFAGSLSAGLVSDTLGHGLSSFGVCLCLLLTCLPAKVEFAFSIEGNPWIGREREHVALEDRISALPSLHPCLL